MSSETKTETQEVEKKDNLEESKSENASEKTPCYFSPLLVSNQFTYGSVILREFKIPGFDVDGAAMFEAFPSSEGSFTSIIVANFMLKQLKLPLIGDIICPQFPPLTVVRGGFPSTGARIYGNKRIVIVVSEYRLQEAHGQNEVAQALHDFALRHNCNIICMNAVENDPTKEKEILDLNEIKVTPGYGQGSEDYIGDDDEEEDDGYGPEIGYGGDDGFNYSSSPISSPISSPRQTKSSDVSHSKRNSEKQNTATLDKGQKVPKVDLKSDKEKKGKKQEKTKQKSEKNENNDEKSDDKDGKEDEYKEKIWFMTNNEEIGNKLTLMGHTPVREYFCKGVPAGLISLCSFTTPQNGKTVPIVLLLAPLDTFQIGTRSAVTLLKCINDLVLQKSEEGSISIDISELKTASLELEKKIQDIISKVSVHNGPSSHHTSMYS